MPRHKPRRIEQTNRKATDTSGKVKPLNVIEQQFKKLEEKPESSQLPDLPHKNIGDLIQEKQGEKAACEKAFSDLLKRTEETKKELKRFQKNKKLSREALVEQQLAVIKKDPYLNDLMLKNILSVEEELGFLKYRRGFKENLKLKCVLQKI